MHTLRRSRWLPLALALAAALALRLALWGRIPRTGLISDEGEYLAAATWLAQGRGFSWYAGYLWTRAPLYPLFVAAHLRLFGPSPAPIYISQALLGLANVALVYLLALQLVPGQRRTLAAFVAALLMALYLPLALYAQVLLSETLFLTLLLGGFACLLAARPTRRGLLLAAAGGALFGLATLTRSLALGFAPLAALWLLLAMGPGWRRGAGLLGPLRESLRGGWRHAGLFAGAMALVMLPWTAYNSARVYGGLVMVDTTGAFNLMLGARTAYDGQRQDAPPRNFALALLGQLPADQLAIYRGAALDQGGSCLLAQGDPRMQQALDRAPVPQATVQQLMTAEGLCLIQRRPLAFVAKSAGELLDFFRINYSGDERFTDGFALGRLPRWYALTLFTLDDTLYVLTLPLAALGWAACAAQGVRKKPWLVLLFWLFNLVVAPVLFAINRFRLPLLPFAFIFAGYALALLPARMLRVRPLAAGVAALLFLLAATPYAYLEPGRGDSAWASYLGRYPSSAASTGLALAARDGYLAQERMRLALRAGDGAAAALARPAELKLRRAGKTQAMSDAQIVDALAAAAQGRAAEALAALPSQQQIAAAKDVEAAVVRGDLLRTLGRTQEANAQLTEQFVDDANPVQWAWDWLAPAPTTAINVGGNLDVGYLRGCYLGESIRGVDTGNYRWCSDGAQLRFPAAGTGAAQTLVLAADGRGWQGFGAAPPVRVLLGEREAGSFTPSMDAPQEFRVALPPTPAGQDVVITLRTATFIPDAGDYNRQQGALAGQVRQLGVRLDWAELRGAP